MSKAFSLRSLFQVGIYTFGLLLASSEISLAQITSDNTTNTQVNTIDNVAEITGGETREGNLFHSFQDFSVQTGNEAFFNNASDISNIFSRVTGGNISNIDGLIRANGSANLFLINPAGILFGENASLNIGGSFYGSSASSIVFENGEFSTDLDNPPLLTVNAPIGLGFRDNPGEIINRSFVQNSVEEFVGLEVTPGNNLALIGGNIKFEAGEATAKGGNIDLGGLSAAGTVNINEDGSFNFPQDIAKADVSLSNAADVDVRGTGGGNININARNLEITAGDLGSSILRAGIIADSTSVNGQAGNIVINTTENIAIDESLITNQVASSAVGNAGNITISTKNLALTNGSLIDAATSGLGNAGTIDIISAETIIIDGEDADGLPSRVRSSVFAEAVGNGGGVNISTDNLALTNGGTIDASTLGQGDAGTIDIIANNSINIDGENSNALPSRVTSSVFTEAIGNGGGVNIITNNLAITNGGEIDTSTFGQGDAGTIDIIANDSISIDGRTSNGINGGVSSRVFIEEVEVNAGGINIATDNLTLTNGGLIDVGTGGQGDAGTIDIIANDSISIDGDNFGGVLSGVYSTLVPGAEGDAGGINITTGSLSLTNGGQIGSSTEGQGNAGVIEITTRGSISIDGETSEGENSAIRSGIGTQAEGNSDGIKINANSLSLTNGGIVDASTSGQGNAGAIEITSSESITIDGEDADGFPSGVTSIVSSEATGNSGGVTITTDTLSLTNAGRVAANALGGGNAGEINIKAQSIDLDGNNARIRSLTSSGLGGIINLEVAENITLKNNSLISAEAFGNANGGNLTIDTNFIVAFEGNNDIIASAEQGQGGNINITAESLLGITAGTLNPFTNDINASSEFGLNGNVTLDVPDVNSIQGASELSTSIVVPEETSAQACNANREIAAQNGFAIKGKGGVPPAPELPMDSSNIIIGGEVSNNDGLSVLPQPVKTSLGDIQPARGIKVTEKGGIILTAYRTNNQGTRLPDRETSCGLRKN